MDKPLHINGDTVEYTNTDPETGTEYAVTYRSAPLYVRISGGQWVEQPADHANVALVFLMLDEIKKWEAEHYDG
jgi:hypothetical protein